MIINIEIFWITKKVVLYLLLFTKTITMFVYYHNNIYFSMSETKGGQRRTYKVKYFPFLLDKEIDILKFYDSPIEFEFIRFTDEELKQLEVFKLLDGLVYN